MIRMIIHQIWNQRRQNLWIWLELAVLSAFLWIVLDPLFTMVCLKHVPKGFDSERIYFVQPTCSSELFGGGKPLENPNFVPAMDNLLTQLQNHPRVEAVCLGCQYQVPGGGGWNGGTYYRNPAHARLDEGKEWKDQDNYVHVQWFNIPYVTGLEKWTDMLYVLGIRDAVSGEYLHVRPDAWAQRLIYISAGMATKLYGTPNVKDSTVFTNWDDDPSLGPSPVEHGRLRKIDAVYADVKSRDYETPYASLFFLQNSDDNYVNRFGVYVRLKEGADGDAFMDEVRGGVLKDCCTDPFIDFSVTSLNDLIQRATETGGANDTVRLQAAPGFFGLLCVFLGVSGLFWVRCGERRQDIGVMRSLGASRRAVNRQMLLEGTVLLTAAFLVAMLFVWWYVHKNGYDMGLTEQAVNWNGPDMTYWFNRPVPHILSVTALTYVLMLVITLLGTWVPVQRATRISPCDALRDE